MYDSETNPKMVILVINLPQTSQSMIACGEEEEKIMGENINWVPLKKDKSEIQAIHDNTEMTQEEKADDEK